MDKNQRLAFHGHLMTVEELRQSDFYVCGLKIVIERVRFAPNRAILRAFKSEEARQKWNRKTSKRLRRKKGRRKQ